MTKQMAGLESTSGEPLSSDRQERREAVLRVAQNAAREAVTQMHRKVPKVALLKRFAGSQGQLREFLT
jgi:hypothetical protein